MASADPLLTTQCSVCRAGPPRYRCPRCSLQYCSVLCNRRHRARTNCSGIRDVTTFVPRSTLRTAQGIDRDYNFLQGIDVARSVAVKHVVDERRVLRAHEAKAVVLNEEDSEEKERNNDKNNRGRWQHKHNKYGRRGQKSQNQRNNQNQNDKKEQGQTLYKMWEGEEVVYRPSRKMAADAAAALLESVRAEAAAQDSDDSDDDSDTPKTKTKSSLPKPPTFEAGVGPRVRSKCRRKNIDLLGAPPGFMRQKQNQTTIVTETLRGKGGAAATTVVFMHWQVEWVIYADTSEGTTPTQVLRRAKDWTPLYRAYAALQQAEKQRQEREAKLGNALVKEVAEGEDTVKKGEKNDKNEKNKDTAMDTRGDSDDEAEVDAESQSPRQSRRNRKPRHKKTAPFNNSFFFAYDVQHAQDVILAQDPATAEAAATAVPTTTGTSTATSAWHDRAVTDDMPEQDVSVHMYHNARYEYSYYLLKPHVPGVARASQAKELIPIDSADTLSTILPGRSVLEFPTIYVLPRGAPLPKGHVLGSVGRRVFFEEPAEVKGKQQQQKATKANGANKRQNNGKQGPNAKKLKTSGKNNKNDSEEEGEILEGSGDVELPDAKTELESETSSSGTDSSEEEEEEEEEEEKESSEDDEDGEAEESNGDEKGPVTLSHLLNTIGNAGTMPVDGKPKLVVYDSWSEGSDDE